MGKRNHHGHAVVIQPEEVEALVVGAEGPSAYVLDRPNAVIGINNFLADVKGHARTPVHYVLVACCNSVNLKLNSTANSHACQYDSLAFEVLGDAAGPGGNAHVTGVNTGTKC